MHKSTFTLCALAWLNLSLTTALAQRNPNFFYKAPDFKERVARHKTIAILPFGLELSGKQDVGNLHTDQQLYRRSQESELLQSNMYIQMLQQQASMTATPQNILKTNEILKQINYTYQDSATAYTYRRLADTLGVDAVLVGKIVSYDDEFRGGRGGTTLMSYYNVDAFFYVYDHLDGAKLWQIVLNSVFDLKLSKQKSGELEALCEGLASTALKEFPYLVPRKRK